MSDPKTTRELFVEAYKDAEQKVEKQKEQKRKAFEQPEQNKQMEIDIDQASPFMLMKLGFEKLLEQDQKESLDD